MAKINLKQFMPLIYLVVIVVVLFYVMKNPNVRKIFTDLLNMLKASGKPALPPPVQQQQQQQPQPQMKMQSVPAPTEDSISYDPITRSYIPPNPGGTEASCAGFTGATCTACCKAKGLSNCDCSTAQYARALFSRIRIA